MRKYLSAPLRAAAGQHRCNTFLRSIDEIPSIFARDFTSRPSHKLDSQVAIREPLPWPHNSHELYQSRQKSIEKQSEKLEPALKDPDAVSVSVQAAARREIIWLADPLKFSQRIRLCMEKGNIPLALTLLRLASKTRDVVGSWNNAVDYFALKGEIMNAVRVYNEMKKRQQFPDARTYTILLRGILRNNKDKEALSKALSIYHSMEAPGSKVKPNIIHTNTVLEICSRVHDTDAMWGIVGKLPENGPGAANHSTYTTLLNALRWEAVRNENSSPLGSHADAADHPREVAVARGKAMWFLIADKWQQLELQMDEKLMRAMCLLLLCSSEPSNWDSVLSLITQVTGVPRQLKPLMIATAEANSVAPDNLSTIEPGTLVPVTNMRLPTFGEGANSDPFAERSFPTRSDRSAKGRVPVEGLRKGSVVATGTIRPNIETLTAVLDACLQIDTMHPNIGAAAAARAYWTLLTDPKQSYAIVPDKNNLYSYLRILRRARASGEVLEVLKANPGIIDEKAFKIAMPACARNFKSYKSLSEALEVYKMMMERAEKPDFPRMRTFVELLSRHAQEKRQANDCYRALEALLVGVPPMKAKAPTIANCPIIDIVQRINQLKLDRVDQKDAIENTASICRLLIGIIDSLKKPKVQTNAGTTLDLEEARKELSRLIEKNKADLSPRESTHDQRREQIRREKIGRYESVQYRWHSSAHMNSPRLKEERDRQRLLGKMR